MRFSDYYNIIVNKKLQMIFFTKIAGEKCVFWIKQIIFFGDRMVLSVKLCYDNSYNRLASHIRHGDEVYRIC